MFENFSWHKKIKVCYYVHSLCNNVYVSISRKELHLPYSYCIMHFYQSTSTKYLQDMIIIFTFYLYDMPTRFREKQL